MDDLMPAGWYPDADDPTSLRFWTGAAWTTHRKPRPGIAPAYHEVRSRRLFAAGRRLR